MKIACLATSQIPSTTANSIQVMKTCQALVELGHVVSLQVPWTEALGAQSAGWDELASWYGLRLPFAVEWTPLLPGWKRYDLAWQGMRRAISDQADLLYTWMPQAAVLALMHGLPTILELHDRPMGGLGPSVFRLYLRWPGRKRLVVITQALQRVLESEYHYTFPVNEVVVGPNGVDLERFAGLPDAPQARLELGLSEQPTAVYTGHFYPGRGMDVLLALAHAFPQVNFLWVGGTPEAVEGWRSQLDSQSLGNVILTGFVENRRLPLYQAAGDFLLMPYERTIAGSGGGNSAEICSPMKMFEYLAAGRTILTSDLPVIREVLTPANAVFCPPEDSQAWVQAFGALLDDPARQAALSSQACQDAPRYTWLARARQVLDGF